MTSSDKRALITGIRGQDGSFLADLLLERGYRVLGLTRDPATSFSGNLAHLAGKAELRYSTYDQADLEHVLRDYSPHEVYHLAGQSYVGKSWVMLGETLESVAQLPVRMLEAVRSTDPSIRYFQASSSEVFGSGCEEGCVETSPIAPLNPYGCAKAFAHGMVRAYRLNYGLFAVNGVLFPHESPRRHKDFLTAKLVAGAVRIARGEQKELLLGNLDVARDWGYAPEYVDAMWRMLQADEPHDLVIATGTPTPVRAMVDTVFSKLGLDYQDFVRVDPGLVRDNEVKSVHGVPRAARDLLGWQAETDVSALLDIMLTHEQTERGPAL